MSGALALRASRSLGQYVTSASAMRPRTLQGARNVIVIPIRQFTYTRFLAKKKRNVNHAAEEDGASDPVSKGGKGASITTDAQDEAFDFSSMERKILKTIEHMTHKLADLKTGGSLNPAVLESLHVQPDKQSQDVVKLSDLAQVVTRGRHLNVILSDEAHIKAVKSAIQSSNLSLTPQGPTEEDPTTLVINVPPPTGESRQAALDSATKISNFALDQIRDARQAKHKKLRAMQIAKTVNPDQIQKAQKEMEQIIQRFSTEVKNIADTHKKLISR